MRWFGDEAGLDDESVSRFALAVVEALTNVVRHAYPEGEAGDISLRLSVSEDPSALTCEILDSGVHVPTSDCTGRDLDDVKPGGLGVHIMSCCVDEMTREERPQGGTRLVLRKNLSGDDSSPT